MGITVYYWHATIQTLAVNEKEKKGNSNLHLTLGKINQKGLDKQEDPNQNVLLKEQSD